MSKEDSVYSGTESDILYCLVELFDGSTKDDRSLSERRIALQRACRPVGRLHDDPAEVQFSRSSRRIP